MVGCLYSQPYSAFASVELLTMGVRSTFQGLLGTSKLAEGTVLKLVSAVLQDR